ncbi:MAG: type IVB secretion system apparatus protein IcmL/DotI [Candidatus Berkiella sp.]
MTTDQSKPTSPQKGKTPTPPAGAKAAPPTAKYTGALELIVLRNNFYRDNYRRLMLVCLGLICLTGGLIYWGLYERTHQPLPQYFATTYDGKLIPIIPLSEPGLTPNSLLQWATDAAQACYTFNFVNFRKALQDIRIYFTKSGYQYFLKALKDSNNLDAIQSKQLVVSAVPTGAPVILKKGIFNDGSPTGVYSWTVQLPMQLEYRSSTDRFTQRILLTMLITRVSTLESPKGVAIASFVVSENR